METTRKLLLAFSLLAPDIDGVQNVWIQRVGCGTTHVGFSL
jgi:hypothetical protein